MASDGVYKYSVVAEGIDGRDDYKVHSMWIIRSS
jgi:hypothetical protein